jgi:hypothetical protein
MTATMSANALTDTINGFDELAISKAFGEDITTLKGKPLMFLRAMAFVDHRRQGMKDAPAYKAAMLILSKDLADYFPDDPQESDPSEFEDPVTDEGKDEQPTG